VKLYYSPTSPYARKTRIIAREKGLADRIEEILVNTRDPVPEFLGHTPIGKIPTLVTDDGAVIVESTTISEYLDQIGSGPSLAAGPARFEIMGRTGIGQGVIDAVYSIAMEARRPAELQWAEAVEKRTDVLKRTLPLCKVEPGRFDLGDITLA
jgi:glutathione S-transferase